MKTALISVLAAIVLGSAAIVSSRAFGAAEFTAILFATGLVAWTVEQYSHRPRGLTADRPIRFPAGLARRHEENPSHRLAA